MASRRVLVFSSLMSWLSAEVAKAPPPRIPPDSELLRTVEVRIVWLEEPERDWAPPEPEND